MAIAHLPRVSSARRRTLAERLAEGRHRWGYLEEDSERTAARTGMRLRRLVVFPPGTSAPERRLLALWRRWPAVGGLLALVIALALAPLSSTAAVGVMLVVYAGGWAALATATQTLRRASHSLRCCTVLLASSIHEEGDVALFERCVAVLERLEDRQERGAVGEVEFELGWAQVYDRLGR